jgi:hypothetical protein
MLMRLELKIKVHQRRDSAHLAAEGLKLSLNSGISLQRSIRKIIDNAARPKMCISWTK